MIKLHLPIVKYLGVDAITFWRVVLFSDKAPSDVLVNHERIHQDQMARDGVLRFYSNYLLDYLRNRWSGYSHRESYLRIRYEIEAYQNQHNLEYKVLSK